MNELEKLKEKLGKTSELLEKLDEMLAEGEITEDKYKQLSKKYGAEVKSLKNQIAEGVLKQDFGIETGQEERAEKEKEEKERLRRQKEEGDRAQKERKAHDDAGIRETQSTTSDETGKIQKTCSNSIGMEFVLIPAGEFDMGSPSNEVERSDDEGPIHRVKISKVFYMGKYEITQKQWLDVMGSNPSYFKGDNLPVENVSWRDVQDFIKKLNEMEDMNKYRLPSEAEWEYAARAGTTTRYSFGDDESNLGYYAWYDANAGSKTHPVGQKKPNLWGLYDMHGNVWEWVQDTYHSNYNGAPTDGSAWERNASVRVIRGESWAGSVRYCRSAKRGYSDIGNSDRYIGFRLVRDL